MVEGGARVRGSGEAVTPEMIGPHAGQRFAPPQHEALPLPTRRKRRRPVFVTRRYRRESFGITSVENSCSERSAFASDMLPRNR